nr:Chain B, Nuclear receptor 0B2 [synthetic construct]
PSILKKILLE